MNEEKHAYRSGAGKIVSVGESNTGQASDTLIYGGGLKGETGEGNTRQLCDIEGNKVERNERDDTRRNPRKRVL